MPKSATNYGSRKIYGARIPTEGIALHKVVCAKCGHESKYIVKPQGKIPCPNCHINIGVQATPK